MSDAVVDTNIWVMGHAPPHTHQTKAKLECATTCLDWLVKFRDSNKRHLIVDVQHIILSKYWEYLGQGNSLAREILAHLEASDRIIPVQIAFDENHYAVLPAELGLDNFDPADKKFVAVALTCNPFPPIYNATDSDWREHAAAFTVANLTIVELCLDTLKESSQEKKP